MLALAAATHAWWLAASRQALVHDDGPAQRGYRGRAGRRLLRAIAWCAPAELVKQGYVPKVLVSGPDMLYGFYECDLAIPFAVKRGYPAELVHPRAE